MKKKLTILIVSIILVLLVLSTTTYALFFKQNKLENEESYTAGILDIVLDNDEEGLGEVLRLANSLPITDAEGKKSKPYKFKITNKGNLTYTFDLKMLSTTTSNQIDSNYIKVMIDDNEPVYLSSLASSIIASNLTLNPDESKIMSVRLWLDEYTPNSQIGKVFSAKIVGDGKGSEYVDLAKETLTKLGLTANEGTPDFSQVAITDEGIYSAEDDYGKSYYFRGAVTNNYVKFAGYYWRIIRINGDGSIRMIYDGTVAHDNGEKSTDRRIVSKWFNGNYNYNAYVGYMYGTPGSNTYEAEHTNTNNTAIKKEVDNWYKTNIEDVGFGDKVADVIYCNDRQIASDSVFYGEGFTPLGYGKNQTVYSPTSRVLTPSGYKNVQTPKLTCSQQNDAFTVDDITKGNGALTYPVGLVTMDEVLAAGGKAGTDNTNYYLYTGNYYWSHTPNDFSGMAVEFCVDVNGGLVTLNVNDTKVNVRPVISLKADTELAGTGTKDNPFVVKKKPEKSEQVLIKLGLTAKEGTPKFSEVATSDEGIYSATDDYGISYYFRGGVTNNYVKFANKWWRIIRINGDGTIRMIYDGTIAHNNGESSTDRQIGTSSFSSNYNDNAYVGYMYGSVGTSTYEATHANTNNSTIKTTIDNWYKTNIEDKGLGEKVADAIYCNDRKIYKGSSENGYTTLGYGSNYTTYEPTSRVLIWRDGDSNWADIQKPKLTCSQQNDAFTVNDTIKGNGALTYPVGLVTMDEVLAAGGKGGTGNESYYLYTGSSYWTMSPSSFGSGVTRETAVYSTGVLNFNITVNGCDVKPVISLKSTLEFTGDGTINNPFTPK